MCYTSNINHTWHSLSFSSVLSISFVILSRHLSVNVMHPWLSRFIACGCEKYIMVKHSKTTCLTVGLWVKWYNTTRQPGWQCEVVGEMIQHDKTTWLAAWGCGWNDITWQDNLVDSVGLWVKWYNTYTTRQPGWQCEVVGEMIQHDKTTWLAAWGCGWNGISWQDNLVDNDSVGLWVKWYNTTK